MKIYSRQRYFKLISANHSARSGGITDNRDVFWIFFNMQLYCVFSLPVYSKFSLETPHRGDSNEYKQYTIFSIKKKITLNYPITAAGMFFEPVRNSHVKRAISV